jgi:hypothetical protein
MRAAPNRPSRRSAKGQAMAIFALVSVLLFVVAGLSIDAGTSYLTSNKIERAAAAAALAGVAYLPGDIPDAQNAALVEAARDGFPNAGSGNACPGSPMPSPCVITSEPTTNELQVTIKATVGTIFLRIVGFGSHTVVRSETAQYLPPISLGQPGGQQGSALSDPSCTGLPNYCASTASGLGSGGNNYYFEREEGWGNPRSEGDPFTPSPAQTNNGCGPSGSDNCSAASAPDYHAISTEAGTAPPADSTLNYAGGSNYLITIPNGQSADPQIFNPAFAPDTCDGGQTAVYCYHEDDSSFSGTGAPNTAYSAMEYTLYQVSTLSSRTGDVKVSQEVFYPYNATGLSSTSGWFYYCGNTSAGASCSSTQTNISNAQDSVPATYHQWISAIRYNPTNTYDKELFKDQTPLSGSGYLVNNSGATEYYRLEVDTLAWNGVPSCSATAGPCSNPVTGTSSYSEAHKGYAVRLVTDNGSPSIVQGTVSGSTNCTNCSMSSMDDMTVFTPVNGATTPQFKIPLFSVDPTAYAGQTINVDLFDIGDVGGGPAYVGLQEPDGVTWATANSVIDLGASLAGASPPSTGGTVTSLGTWPGSGGGSCTGCFQTAGSGGGAIYQGQWVQMQIQIPASFTGPGGITCTATPANCYWNLVYDVSPAAVAGDTFSVEVGFDGSPDHLLP